MFIRNERSIKEFVQLYPIVSILVAIHIVLYVMIDILQLPFAYDLLNWGIGFNPAVSAGEYWRLITPIFFHAGLMHMLFNSFSLVLFGPALEQMLGRFKFSLAYLLMGIAGNVGTYIMNPDSPTAHLGASGAIYGIFGIYIYMIAMRKDLIDQGSTQIIMVIFIIGMVMTFLRPNINISAHVFGFVGGLALAPLILIGVQAWSPWRTQRTRRSDKEGIQFDPNRWKKKAKRKKRITTFLWIALGALVLIGLLSRINIL
ncbi:Rhomboid protease [Lentibacillus sp. JNUCC-1]|uniref:rhomboid family intramembrane serine protease n=1 Tax=Lentibacillus sp. JNUCC-1 TaxID=2654513 RepID=UPI0012E956D1|nr:rhomboid family intramembrane serine protease [Lentibacillus sp. JNUCC-1]MUV38496.1 Rhomboid protease [Lentibacillus sp. JNUCC-1]